MNPEEIQELEERRKQREEEMLLLLLLLLGSASVEFAKQPAAFDAVVRPDMARIYAAGMADAHADGMAVYRPGIRVGDLAAVEQSYLPTAFAAASGALETIARFIQQAEGDVAAGLKLAQYTKADPTNLKTGIERNVVSATNAGLLAAAVESGETVTGFEHLSVIDEGTTAICRPRNGLRLPTLHPYWQTNWPSLHWRCRSICVPLAGSFTPGNPVGLPSPLPGFGIAPPVVLLMLDRVAGRQSTGKAA